MKTKEVIKILEENKITNVVKKEKDFYDREQEKKKLLDMSMEESNKQKDERTHSEKMQDELEPILCPMHEDYDK